jgi:cell division protein FtsW
VTSPPLTRTRRRADTDRPRRSLLARPLTTYYLLIGCTLLLLALGLVMVLSASSVAAYVTSGSSFAIASKQAMWVAIGLPVMVVAARLPVAAFRLLAVPLLIACVAGLVLVLIPGVGVSVMGAARWIGFGQFTVQPSEPAKLALALWGADLLARKTKLLEQWSHLLVPLVPVAGFMAMLVMLEPDLGTTLILITIMVTLLWVVGAPTRVFGMLSAGLVALVGLLILVEPYRLARLQSFLHSAKGSATGAGYQGLQGLYALASGHWFGVGLGASREKWLYLPNQYTDYIFAIIGEELGLIGTVVVVVLFLCLGYAGMRVAQQAQDTFVRLAAAGVTAWLVVQAFVNMGAVVGILPITGIPLPMVSFGGSSLVPTLFAVGMLISFARNEPTAAAALTERREARRRNRRWLSFGR